MKFKKSSFNLANSNYNFVKNSKWYWIGSGVIIFIAVVVLCIWGLNLGLDFTGGTVINVKLGDQISTDAKYNKVVEDLEKILKNNGLTIATNQKEGRGNDATVVIKFQDKANYNNDAMSELIVTVRTEINEYFNAENFTELGDKDTDITYGSERITAAARNDLLFNAFVAILFVISLILLYIAIRFQALSGLASILGLAHDVLIAFAFIIIFRIPVNSTVIAAIITIIGYSLNNSIIIFDRIRENLKKPSLTHKTNSEIANLSIKQTLARSINTTLTTLFAVSMLALISVPSVSEFVIIIIFGLLAGMYSSLFLVPEFWAKVNIPRKIAKPQVTNETEESETNDKDSSAEVIEVTD